MADILESAKISVDKGNLDRLRILLQYVLSPVLFFMKVRCHD